MSAALMSAIAPRSDQINADDLVGGDMVVTVKRVAVVSGDQPVQITLAETPKFFRPCKSMSRLLVALWGPDTDLWPGRSMRLYRDPDVKWGGVAIGGIRISEVSHIAGAVTLPLTEKRGVRKLVSVRPLAEGKVDPKVQAGRDAARAAALKGTAEFTAWWNSADGKAYRGTKDDILDELKQTCAAADEQQVKPSLEDRLREQEGAERAEEPPATEE